MDALERVTVKAHAQQAAAPVMPLASGGLRADVLEGSAVSDGSLVMHAPPSSCRQRNARARTPLRTPMDGTGDLLARTGSHLETGTAASCRISPTSSSDFCTPCDAATADAKALEASAYDLVG